MQAVNAVEQAREQLHKALRSHSLAALDEAISQGESVLKTIRSPDGSARTQSLAMVDSSDSSDVQDWLGRAQHARSKAQQLATLSSDGVEALQAEKRRLKEKLQSNQERIERIEAYEDAAHAQRAPESVEAAEAGEDEMAAHEAMPDVEDDSRSEEEPQSEDADTERSVVHSLEDELQRQVAEYKEAREIEARKEREQEEEHTEEHIKERQLVDEINHVKQARLALMQSDGVPKARVLQAQPHGPRPLEQARMDRVQTGAQSRGRRIAEAKYHSSSLVSEQRVKQMLEAKERRIHAELAKLDKEGGSGPTRDLRGAARAAPAPESGKIAHGTPVEAARDKKHMSVLQGFEMALGDSQENAKKALHAGASAAAAHHPVVGKDRLPGVNAYSWWSQKSARIAAKKAQLAQIRKRLRAMQETKRRAAKTNCHNLYACISSMFSGGEDSNKLAHADRLVQAHRQQKLAAFHGGKGAYSGHWRPASDVRVSRGTIMDHPQEPLLGILAGSSHSRTNKLPGVMENRWGGTKFWDRLLGEPATPHGTPVEEAGPGSKLAALG